MNENDIKKLREISIDIKKFKVELYGKCPRASKMSSGQFKEFDDLDNSLNKAIWFMHHAIACAIRYKEAAK